MTRRAGPYRLTYGGEIDRTRRLVFRFDGETFHGHPGDTLASALLANGVRTVARSFKFHRPRGVYSCGVEEPNALLRVGTGAHAVPSARAPVIELTDCLEAFSQEGWPSLRCDVGRILDCVAPLWSAGFYNKTFIWPGWHVYEGTIRRLAGLGRAPQTSDPDRYEVCNLHCDVLVVGGGTAGLEAALEAARGGERVVLVEQDGALGGQASWDGSVIELLPAPVWIRNADHELSRLPDVRVMTRTTAVGHYDHGVVALLERTDPMERANANPTKPVPRERYWMVRTGRVVLATGTIEQPLVFSHNDRPGIILAGAARQYLRRYGVAVGSRVLIATNNDSAYALAAELHQHGVTVLGVVDSRSSRTIPESLRQSMRRRFIEVLTRSVPIDSSGFSALKSVTIGRLTEEGRNISVPRTFQCDALAVSGGFAPALQIYAQAGGQLRYDNVTGVLQPVTRHPSIEIVGAAAHPVPIGPRVAPLGKRHRQWVDLLHDVTVADLELALRENYSSIEHVKRYTTVGMAADQGKTSTAAALDVVGRLRTVHPRELGHTTLRPPVTPVTLGAIAGREISDRFAPTRHLPMHNWHLVHGGVLQDFGTWQRPVAYVRQGESRDQAVRREARAVRTQAGLFDGSSLGKIEVQGPDALEFLDRFYINSLAPLQPGRARYGLMLRETGTLLDDGTVAVLAPEHCVLTTTSGNAARVYQWLEEWHQCEWPSLRVAITQVTEQWATLSLAGPAAREILGRLETDLDLTPGAFPHLGLRVGELLGAPARIYRVSFTGELTYEINVPSEAGPRIWEALLEAGEGQGLQPFGMDALLLLRLEKGFLHLGTDTDGTTIPDDVGWGHAARNKARDFIGKRSLNLREHLRADRLQLVGLKSTSALVVGAHLRGDQCTAGTEGWVTSAGVSVLAEEPVAMALLRAGRHRIGTEIDVYDAGRAVARAAVVRPTFYDSAGARMNA
jgi:sarcosine oxidase subunit alpha